MFSKGRGNERFRLTWANMIKGAGDNPLQTLRDLLRTREPYYLEVADIVVQTGKQKVSVIVREIERKLKQLQDVSDANA